jgi:Protein of unknown function (DUF1573)
MKKNMVILLSMMVMLTVVFTLYGSPQPLIKALNDAAFNWKATSHNFGKIKVGVPVSHEFSFTNKGKGTLIISGVQASCGCTVTEYTKSMIAPGGSGFVKATYNAAKVGVFSKSITVTANTNDEMVKLEITGEVVE